MQNDVAYVQMCGQETQLMEPPFLQSSKAVLEDLLSGLMTTRSGVIVQHISNTTNRIDPEHTKLSRNQYIVPL